jgi:hypothetical protein
MFDQLLNRRSHSASIASIHEGCGSGRTGTS